MPSIPSAPNVPQVWQSVPLPAVPLGVLLLVMRWWSVIEPWLGQVVYAWMIGQNRDHPLVRLARAYDLAGVIEACQGYHRPAGGRGAPATYEVGVLVRAEVVRAALGNLSDRDLAGELAGNVVVRWYVGLPLFGPSPEASTLSRFHAWLGEHHPLTLFHEVLAFLDEVDPEDPRQTLQVADTFAMQTPAAATNATGVLLGLLVQVQTLWALAAPLDHEGLLTWLTEADLRPKSARSAATRLKQVQTAVALATRVRATLAPHLGAVPDAALRHELSTRCALLAKVIADETTTDAAGLVVERKEKGSYRLASPHDCEATFRHHAPSPPTFGYNVGIATTPTRIRAVVALTGSTPDGEVLAPLLRQQRDAGLPLPQYLLMDAAGGAGTYRAQVARLSGDQTTLVAPLMPGGGLAPDRFGPDAFDVPLDRDRCTCPNGVTSTTVYRHGSGSAVQFRFTATHCQGCPLWQKCRTGPPDGTGHRTVTVSDYHAHVRLAGRFNQSPKGLRLLRQRWRVEPTIGWLVRYEGVRHSRRLGLAAAQFQVAQAAAWRNLARWLERVKHGTATHPASRPALAA